MAADPTKRLKSDSEEAYAQERAWGYRPFEAARRCRLNPKTGIATKYEEKPRVQKRIAFLRKDDLSTEMREAKRRRLEERLELAAFGNMLEFGIFDDAGQLSGIQWSKLSESDLAPLVSEFRFDKDTGKLVAFKRDDPLAAIAQLRDMRGFKTQTHLAAEAKLEQAREAQQGKEGEAVVTRFTLSIFDDREAIGA